MADGRGKPRRRTTTGEVVAMMRRKIGIQIQDIDDSIRRSPNWLEKVELLKSVPALVTRSPGR
jgi:hypothetical protein